MRESSSSSSAAVAPWLRWPVLFVAFVVGMAPLVLGSLLGPTLVFLAPILLPSGACLISGTVQLFDEVELAALRARRGSSATPGARALEPQPVPIK